MSREAPAGLAVIEKVFGLMIIVMGGIVFYYTQNTEGIEGVGRSFFVFFGLALVVLGVFMTYIKVR
jgi:hypothetical protein